MQARHGQAFMKFNSTFPPIAVTKWEKMVSNWDKDNTKKNPYEEPVAGRNPFFSFRVPNLPVSAGTTMTDVQLKLANEEN
jgi:hypothetical protein